MSSKISPRCSSTASSASPPVSAAAALPVPPRPGGRDKVAPRRGEQPASPPSSFLQDHLQADSTVVQVQTKPAQERGHVWDAGQNVWAHLHSPGHLPDPFQELRNLIAGEARKQEKRHKEIIEALRMLAQSAFSNHDVIHDEPPVRSNRNIQSAGSDGMFFMGRMESPASMWLAPSRQPEVAMTMDAVQQQVEPLSSQDEVPAQLVPDDMVCRVTPPMTPTGTPRMGTKSKPLPPDVSHPSRMNAVDFELETPAGSPNAFIGATRYSSELAPSAILRIVNHARSMTSTSSMFLTVFNEAHHDHHHHHKPPCFMMHPDSYIRFMLDTSSLLMLLLDSLLVPYQVAWDVEFEGIWLYMTWITFIYWTFDMCVGFVAGYYERGELHMSFGDVCRHYLRSAFIPNCIATCCDLAALLLAYQLKDSGALGVGKLPRLIKLHRVIRLIAILRTGKAARLYDTVAARFEEVGFGSSFRATVQVVNITFFLMWMNHLGACIWHVFAQQATTNWYIELGREEIDLSLFDYLLAYLWSTAALLAGESIMIPSTEEELLIAIIFILFGLITSSIIIGYISDTLIDFRLSNKDRADQIRSLRKYMKQAEVPFSFASNLEKEALEVIRTNKRIVEEDVKLLKNISPGGRDKLNTLVFGKVICHDRFLRACHGLSRRITKEISTNAISHVLVEPGDMAFAYDTQAEGAYLVHWGRYDYMTPLRPMSAASAAAVPQRDVSYTRDLGSSPLASQSNAGSTSSEKRPGFGRDTVRKKISKEDRAQTSNDIMSERQSIEHQHSVFEDATGNPGRALNHESVKECQWYCQLALFYHMRHTGSMQAIAVGEHLILNGERLHTVLKTDARLALIARDYSQALVDAIERRYDKRAINELYLPMPHESILPLMPEVTRVLMSQAALDKLPEVWNSAKARQELTSEVNSGRCDLLIDTKLSAWNQPLIETVLRVVSVVVLRLEREDGMVLCQLGKLKDGECKAALRLPGIKVGHGELPADALRRLMTETVEPLKAGIRLGEKEVLEEVKNSATYKIQTKYIRSVFHARLDSDMEFPARLMDVDADKLGGGGDMPPAAVNVKSMTNRHPGKKKQPSRAGTHLWGAVRSFHPPAVDPDVKAFLLGEESADVNNLQKPVFAWLDPDVVETPESLEAKEASIRTWAPGLVAGPQQRVNATLTSDGGSASGESPSHGAANSGAS